MNDVNYLSIKETMSSLEIAELTGMRHSDVIRAIRNMEEAWRKVNGRNFALVEYIDKKGEKRPCYQLNKTECLYVATKFNDESRAKLVLRWEELEQEKQKQTISLPQNYLEALEALVITEKQKQALQAENIKQKEVISHKSDVIEGLTEDIELAEKRQRITQIVRYNSTDFQKRYRLLYKEFELKYHMSLNRRINSEKVQAIKPEIKNKIDYIDRVLNMIPELYEIACKIFETDVKKLIKREWKIYNLQEC